MIAVARRAAQLVGVVFLVALLTFVLQAALPGDAAETRVGPLPNFSPAARKVVVESTRRQLGLDHSYPEQFVRWTVRAVQGDLGKTVEGVEVRHAVGARLGSSVELAFAAVAIAVVVAFALAYWAYSTRHRRAVAVLEGLLSGLLVMPSFWIGFLLVLLFSVQLGWLPSSGYVSFGESPVEHLRRLLMPSVTLALPYGWWRYREEAMMGKYIGAWSNLPIEAPCVWFAVTFTTVIVYEVIKIWKALGRRAKEAFFGK